MTQTQSFGKPQDFLPTENLPLIFWSLLVISFPLYFFSSGTLQPSAGFLAFGIGTTCLARNLGSLAPFRLLLASWFLYATWVSIVNLFWLNSTGDLKFATSSLFYIYNTMVLAFGLTMFVTYRRKAFVVTIWSAVASVVACIVLSPLAPAARHRVMISAGVYDRSVFFFNNPNQFGYFCTLVGTIVFLGMRFGYLKRIFAVPLLMAISVLSLLSLSRATAAASAFLLLLATPFKYLVLAGAVGISVLALYAGDISTINRLEQRFEMMGAAGGPNDIATRLLGRIVDNPDYLVMGAGEGTVVDRFADSQYEIHSTFPNVAFSYGIIGSLIFAVFIGLLLAEIQWQGIIYYIPILLYNATHEGLRFSLFWITLAFALCAIVFDRQSRSAKLTNHLTALPEAEPAPA